MKTNRFLLAAGISLAMAFTFSCSDDDGDKAVVSCKTGVYHRPVAGQMVEICWETAPNLVWDYDSDGSVIGSEKACDSGEFSSTEGCPSGWVAKCAKDGITRYVYGSEGITCSDYYDAW
ncbi:MAG: hypothetical protein FWB90_02700 [Fibromonadales bacterium]|nr:hypothetical protein [Fibromonadales bacterium]